MSRREKDEWVWPVGMDLGKIGEELSRRRPTHTTQQSWEPHIDLVEEEGRLVLKAEISGVRGEDIEVTFVRERNSILIRGNRAEDLDSDQSRVGVYTLEILYGPFEREIRLPETDINPSEIRAIFRHGLLIVLIPKATVASQTVTVRKH